MTVKINDRQRFAERNEYSSAMNLTASAGGGQGNALELTKEYNNIILVASTNDSVKLMSGAAVGAVQNVRNGGTNDMALYPPSGESINQQATNAGIVMYPQNAGLNYEGEILTCWKTDPTKWTCWAHTLVNVNNEKLYQGPLVAVSNFSVGGRLILYGYDHLPVTDDIVAFAGGGQASATALNAGFNIIGTVATAGDSVKLPAPSLAGTRIHVYNSGSNNASVYPQSGGEINILGTNAAYSLFAGSRVIFMTTSELRWVTF